MSKFFVTVLIALLILSLSACKEVSQPSDIHDSPETTQSETITDAPSAPDVSASVSDASAEEEPIQSPEPVQPESFETSSSAPVQPDPAPVAPSMTIGQKNALQSAKSYLSFTAFSYSGLIKQLEYEQYSHEDAVFAADNCGADWNEQAAKSAKSYLEFMSFSRDGLIDQLEYEGFTHEQAVFGVTANGY